jgi:hypothetical protein
LDTDQAILKIKQKIAEIEPLRSGPRFSPEYVKWHREVIVLLERVFSPESDSVNSFKSINFTFKGMHRVGAQEPFERRYRQALEEASAILTSLHEEIAEYGIESVTDEGEKPFEILERMLLRFHAVVKQLRCRHDGRDTLDVRDEYDVQDLVHALLRMFFRDIRAEEWTPSYAGSSSRMDFLLHDEEVVVEAKRMRRGLKEKDVVDQLLIDITRYEEHPKCKSLVCFIYDPEGLIGNPAAIVKDIEKRSAKMAVKVIIEPESQ